MSDTCHLSSFGVFWGTVERGFLANCQSVGDLEEVGGKRSLVSIGMDGEMDLHQWPLRGTSEDQTVFH